MNRDNLLLGAVAGDIIGSVYEFNNHRNTDFPLFVKHSEFTDDTVMTVAVAEWLFTQGDLSRILQDYGNRYPSESYGLSFRNWLRAKNPQPYNSWGNGSAMRVSYVGWAFNSLEEVLKGAKQSAEVTHNHPEGIKGAQATAACIFLARTNHSKEQIKDYVETTFGYDLNRSCDEIRPVYQFNESCQETVPEAIIAFLESSDFENAIRLAISLGGDSDTLAAITGGIAEAYYDGVPAPIKQELLNRLPQELIEVIRRFGDRFLLEEVPVWEGRITPQFINELQPNEIFVFGSNLEGRHAGGAARIAHKQWGAIWGQGVGLQGETYAIPTMHGGVDVIQPYITNFIRFAKAHPDNIFLVTPIGCGIAGFTPEEIAPLFAKAVEVENIWLPEGFWRVIA
ncbi:ADP-ribosylglycohydrolase family protein [Parabacteroides sp. OttesenSCG-928-N08]|nr:ADP-ribosylglycohydrolase family protein [Parabacteroides sp. OttesenSCG-928-N08]